MVQVKENSEKRLKNDRSTIPLACFGHVKRRGKEKRPLRHKGETA
jgi:hypothetical protein